VGCRSQWNRWKRSLSRLIKEVVGVTQKMLIGLY